MAYGYARDGRFEDLGHSSFINREEHGHRSRPGSSNFRNRWCGPDRYDHAEALRGRQHQYECDQREHVADFQDRHYDMPGPPPDFRDRYYVNDHPADIRDRHYVMHGRPADFRDRHYDMHGHPADFRDRHYDMHGHPADLRDRHYDMHGHPANLRDRHYDMHGHPADFRDRHYDMHCGPAEFRDRHCDMHGHPADFTDRHYDRSVPLSDFRDMQHDMPGYPAHFRGRGPEVYGQPTDFNSKVFHQSRSGSKDVRDQKSNRQTSASRMADRSSSQSQDYRKSGKGARPSSAQENNMSGKPIYRGHKGHVQADSKSLSGKQDSDFFQGREETPISSHGDKGRRPPPAKSYPGSKAKEGQSKTNFQRDPKHHCESNKDDNGQRKQNKRGSGESHHDKGDKGTFKTKASYQRADNKSHSRDTPMDQKNRISVGECEDNKRDKKHHRDIVQRNGEASSVNDEGKERESKHEPKTKEHDRVYKGPQTDKGQNRKKSKDTTPAGEKGGAQEANTKLPENISQSDNIEFIAEIKKHAENILAKVENFGQDSVNVDGSENDKTKGHKKPESKVNYRKRCPRVKSDNTCSTATTREKQDNTWKKERFASVKKSESVNNMEKEESKLSADNKRFVDDDSSESNVKENEKNANVDAQRKIQGPTYSKDIDKTACYEANPGNGVQAKAEDIEKSRVQQRHKDQGDERVTEKKSEATNVESQNCGEAKRDGGKVKKYIVVQDVETALRDIDKKNEKFLSEHKSKICQAKTDLETLEISKISGEKDALTDRLRELENQQKEFETCIQELRNTVSELSPQSTTKEELNAILLRAGIECKRLSARLPMYARRQDVVKHVKASQVSIVIGETGSGKSTQMVQYLLEAGLAPGDKQIVCTQPRKVAAVNLTDRVSSEQLKPVGKLVGHRFGVREKISPETKIVFTTDHSLLSECLKDPVLSKYSCIVIDEAHERSIYTDLLLGMIKSFLPERPDLRVVITSATISPELFISYFNTTKEMRVSGRMFPVDVVYEQVENTTIFEKYEQRAINKVCQLHQQEGKGDILVFMPTSAEIMRCCEELPNRLNGRNDFVCLPLHGQLFPEDQKKVFKPVEPGKRKIVFATNCAESSLTIDGIKFVVDTGVANEMRYDPQKNVNSLGIQIISQSSADQRKGRAGRTCSGSCIRLYSREDYEAMSSSMKPEILRIHLGQAILKLAELKADIRNYDFVESPEQEAIDSALSILHGLGALTNEGTQVTDIGKMLAKLPFDPRQGYMVYFGHKVNLLYDSVVVASLISNGSNLIFRGLNESEEQLAARTRNEFGSTYGDVFTWLEIFKCWIKLPKGKRPMWCRERCVSNKALCFAEQTVKDVGEILRKEFDIRLDFTFAEDAEQSINTLRHLIFEAYLPSLSLYLGHHRAGFFATSCQRQVHVHPSSCLSGQSCMPQWIVYLHMTRTSKDFIRGITEVDLPWIKDAIKQGKLPADFMKVMDQKVDIVFKAELGRTAFSCLVGPRFSKLKETEDNLSSSGMSCVAVEADRDLGTYEVYASSPMQEFDYQLYEATINSIIESLRRDDVEFPVGRTDHGFRAQIGPGAKVVALLMPNQSLKVRVSQTLLTVEEKDVREKFMQFGEVTECVKFSTKKCPTNKNTGAWGFVKYRSWPAAQKAVEMTGGDESLRGSFMVATQKTDHWNGFRVKLSWCRRPVKLFKGKRKINIRGSPFHITELVDKDVKIGEDLCRIKMSEKKENELVLFTNNSSEESEIHATLSRFLGLTDFEKIDLKVEIVKEWIKPEEENLERMKQYLEACFRKVLPENSRVNIDLKPPKQTFFKDHVAIILFDNAVAASRACRKLERSGLCVDGNKVKIEPDLRTSFVTLKSVFKVCESKFNKIVDKIKADYTNISVGTRALQRGDLAVDIQATDETALVKIKDALQKELMEGDSIDCSVNDLLKHLLSKQGRQFLSDLERQIGGVIMRANTKLEKVHLFGSDGDITAAKSKINEYLDKCSQGVQEDLVLNGPDRPLGLMKKVLHDYPNLPEDFVSQFGVTDVTIDYKQSKMTVFGTKEAVTAAINGIEEIQKTLKFQDSKSRRKTLKVIPDCEVCLCPVDSATDLYRLEGCGHAYCLTCLKQQLRVEIESKQIPILCAKETCRLPWVWKDIQFCLRKNWVTETRLLEQAMDAFVSSSQDKYRFCTSPDCQIAYEVTSNEEGLEFICPDCKASICTSCHKAYHGEITCLQASTLAAADKDFEELLRNYPDRFKACPGCSTPIEKKEGCNNMHCISCKVCFCWVCREKFDHEQDCYRHLMKVHNSFI